MSKITVCLWYDRDAEAAARFYAETFHNSAVGAMHRASHQARSGARRNFTTQPLSD